MKNLAIVLSIHFLLISSVVIILAQTKQNNVITLQEQRRRQAALQRRQNRPVDPIQEIEDESETSPAYDPAGALNNISNLYRKTKKDELKLLAPLTEDLNKYFDFLRQPNTGLIKLVDKGCEASPKVVVATEDCLMYKMPGAGSSYSFRKEDYRLSQIADITLKGDEFLSNGIRSHEIFTDIGDVPLEKVDPTTNGINYLLNFKPQAEFNKAAEIDRQLVKGVTEEGFLYKRSVKVRENTTYLLRSVAYRGEFYRVIGQFIYNELDFDKRKDVIVAFRVVRKENDGALTILWKLLSKQDSPKTSFATKDVMEKTRDFTYKNKQ